MSETMTWEDLTIEYKDRIGIDGTSVRVSVRCSNCGFKMEFYSYPRKIWVYPSCPKCKMLYRGHGQ